MPVNTDICIQSQLSSLLGNGERVGTTAVQGLPCFMSYCKSNNCLALLVMMLDEYNYYLHREKLRTSLGYSLALKEDVGAKAMHNI